MAQLIPGVSATSRTSVYKRKAIYKRKKFTVAKKQEPTNTLTGKFYPGEDVSAPKVSRKNVAAPKIRSSITPGTVLILLSGRFRGKRVVFLKQLESGLLLVSGPHKVNGVPLRRVNQSYVIATSTKIDISSIKLDAKFNDAYFKKTEKRKRLTPEQVLDSLKEKKPLDASRVADQKAVDSKLVALIKKVPNLKQYLSAPFALSKGQYPHVLKF
jgi:large subunit ribosomal protein L6e